MRLDRKALHYQLKRISHIKTWQLLALLVVMCVIAASLLRLNNLAMMDHRDRVEKADASGNMQEVRKQLIALQEYVTSHMNTSLDKGIYLEKSYERDQAAAVEAASNDSGNPNATIQQQAAIECRARFHGGVASYRNDYVRCVAERMAALAPSSDPTHLKLPQAENYHYNFFSPFWSADPAGIVVLICVMLASVIIWRLVFAGVLHLLLRLRYRSM